MQINPLEAVEAVEGLSLHGLDEVFGQVQFVEALQPVESSRSNGLDFVQAEAEAHE